MHLVRVARMAGTSQSDAVRSREELGMDMGRCLMRLMDIRRVKATVDGVVRSSNKSENSGHTVSGCSKACSFACSSFSQSALVLSLGRGRGCSATVARGGDGGGWSGMCILRPGLGVVAVAVLKRSVVGVMAVCA